MNKKTYIPHPADTSAVKVPEDLLELSEYLAKNSHEVWAEQRMRDGWVFGEFRDAERKTHPDLVPYEELPEEEKVYDRNTSMETIRLILSLGYSIERTKP